jgi:hypothetical protein
MTEPGKGRDRTGGAGQESVGGGDQPEERFKTPSGGAIPHHGKGPNPREKPDPTAQADGDDGDPRTGGRGKSDYEEEGD